MNNWLYPANIKYYDVLGAFSRDEIYWPQNSKVFIGDIIYIYLAVPYKQIGYKCEVVEVDLQYIDIIESIRPFFKGKIDNNKTPKLFMKLRLSSSFILDSDSPLSYNYLKQNGLKGFLMGPRNLSNNPVLLDYILRSV